MSKTITIAELDAMKPCAGSSRRVKAALLKLDGSEGRSYSAADARKAGCTYEDIIWAASAVARTDKEVKRRIRHWMADCATRVLHIYERDYPNDTRVREAIQATHEYADGRINDAARDAARAAAGAAARAAAGAAAWDAAWAAARAAAGAAEEDWQFDRLIEWLALDAPEPLPMPGRKLAEAAA